MQAARCLAELGVPHYHHEFVKRALLAAFENPKAAPVLLSLLAHLGDSNQITQVRFTAGPEAMFGIPHGLVLWPARACNLADITTCCHPLPADCLPCCHLVSMTMPMTTAILVTMLTERMWAPLQTQMRKGFERVATDMPDIRLDLPNAPAAFADFRKQVRTCVSGCPSDYNGDAGASRRA